jgi:hypothetical protein
MFLNAFQDHILYNPKNVRKQGSTCALLLYNTLCRLCVLMHYPFVSICSSLFFWFFIFLYFCFLFVIKMYSEYDIGDCNNEACIPLRI